MNGASIAFLPVFQDRVLMGLGAAFYGIAFLFALFFLVRSRRHSRPILFVLVLSGFVLQTTGLYQRGMDVGGCPVGNPFEIIQFIVWSLVILYIVVGPAFRMSLLGFFTSATAGSLAVVSLLVREWDATRQEHVLGPNPWIEIHAALALFSYGAFGLLALTSLMYMLQNYSLKRKQLQSFFSFLPSLTQLEQMNFRLLITGVSILTFSLAVGMFYWLGEDIRVDSPKLLITLAIWAAYAGALGLRAARILVSRGLALACVILFGAALLSIWPIDASRHAFPAPVEDVR